MSESAAEGTGAGLQDFLAWAGRTGEMNPTTAEAWAVACRRVLALEDDPENVDLRQVDVDTLLSRFENLNRTKFTSSSMKTYQSRFRAAVTAYLAWLANEPWKPAKRLSRKKSDSGNGSGAATPASGATEKSTTHAAVSTPKQPAHETAPRLVTYQVPLRPDLMISISLPVDLNEADAARISAFVSSLAFTVSHSPTMSASSGLRTDGG
ncbi:hypothetical protein [Nocardioides baculatus]|uniref:Core-binding (CB) domain-containing protein n=1 Tax=Nocardioides baculatus TaxID=2801337 RepID=A0ABS1LCI7_9ACTN|nr:hypothetical protein [Nocardioides baculatus]MBL0749399.1 hypothetical protein [Nocardioides baculatus]